MYHHDTDGDVLLFATGAVERLRIDANGHIGINRTPASIGDGGSPRLLQVAGYGSGAYGALNLISDQTGDGATAGAISFASSGAGSSDKRLAILLATSDGSSASGANGRLYFYTAAGGANTLALFIDSVGRIATGGMTIHSSLLRGDLVVGRSSATGSGTIYFGSNNQHAFLYYSSAQFVLGRGSAGVNSTIDNSGLTTNTSSEFVNGRRYKERRGVIDPDQAMAWLRSIPPRRYRVVNEQRERLGFFAEELHAASPYLSDGKGYTPQNLDVALVAAIQQLDRRLTARERQSA
jgi:hypothetical protein